MSGHGPRMWVAVCRYEDSPSVDSDLEAGRCMSVFRRWTIEGPAPFDGLVAKSEEHATDVAEALNSKVAP